VGPDDAASGVVAIVPWERPGKTWERLWSTAIVTTQGADQFFAALPRGKVAPAVRFAIVAELLAIGSTVTLLAVVAAFVFPEVMVSLLVDDALRMEALRLAVIGLPLLTAWMVLAHALHGVAVDAGAARVGGISQRRRALRFGLYACGWDLMTSPLGAVVTLFSKGVRAMLGLVSLAMGVPSRASQAMLRGVYGLPDELCRGAQRTITRAVIVTVAASALLCIAVLLLIW
jgi:hypothetical protein